MTGSFESFVAYNGEAPAPAHKRVGLLVGIGLMMNYILGVGILELPSSFASAGVILAPVAFLLAIGIVLVTLLWVLEASARARGFANVYLVVRVAQLADEDDTSERERLAPLLKRAGNAKFVSFFAVPGDEKPNSLAKDVGAFLNPRKLRQLVGVGDGSVQSLLEGGNSKNDLITRSLTFDLEYNREMTDVLENKYKSLNHGENKSFELSELMSMFCPAWTGYVYEVSLGLLLYLGMFSFTAVFANSMTAKLPVFAWGEGCDVWSSGCEHSFIMWLLGFGVVVILLSLLEVVEMVWFQMILSAARFLLVGLLVFVSLASIANNPIDNKSLPGATPPYLSPTYHLWNWDGAISVVTSAIFSMLITFGVPEIITPLKQASDSRRLLTIGLLMIGMFYIAVGVTTALYFGGEVKSQINVNFASYRGGAALTEDIPVWAEIISFFVAIFPALDVISMFPLIAIVQANTFYSRLIRFKFTSKLSNRALRIMCRLAAAIVPIVIPLFQRDLSAIVKYAVVPGVYIAFVAPALVQMYSVRMCLEGGVDPKTPYTHTILMHKSLPYITFVLAAGFWAMIFYSLAQ